MPGRPPTTKKSGRIAIPVTVVALAGLVIAGLALAPSDPDDIAYCVDEQNVVVADDECDSSRSSTYYGGPRFVVIGSHGTGIPVGSRLDSSNTRTRVSSTDTAGRSAAGVSSSGSVKGGTSVSGKSGGFGGKLFGGGSGGSSGGG